MTKAKGKGRGNKHMRGGVPLKAAADLGKEAKRRRRYRWRKDPKNRLAVALEYKQAHGGTAPTKKQLSALLIEASQRIDGLAAAGTRRASKPGGHAPHTHTTPPSCTRALSSRARQAREPRTATQAEQPACADDGGRRGGREEIEESEAASAPRVAFACTTLAAAPTCR